MTLFYCTILFTSEIKLFVSDILLNSSALRKIDIIELRSILVGHVFTGKAKFVGNFDKSTSF